MLIRNTFKGNLAVDSSSFVDLCVLYGMAAYRTLFSFLKELYLKKGSLLPLIDVY